MARLVYALYALSVALIPLSGTVGLRRWGTVIQVSDLAFAACAAAWLVAVLGQKLSPRLGKQHIALLGYGVAIGLSLTATPDLEASLVKVLAVAYLVTLMTVTTSLAADESQGGWTRVLWPWTA